MLAQEVHKRPRAVRACQRAVDRLRNLLQDHRSLQLSVAIGLDHPVLLERAELCGPVRDLLFVGSIRQLDALRIFGRSGRRL